MLYVTTRSSTETYTAARTLAVNTAPDGGLFVPFQMPSLSVGDLKGKTQSECIAYVLGLFFRTKLTQADVAECIGEDSLALIAIDRKVSVLQGWNRANREFSKMEYALYCKLCKDVTPCKKTTQWPKIAIRIAIFAAVIMQMYEGREVDIAVNAGDFLTPMTAFYCRQIGLPVGTILCAVNENSGLWDFFTNGQLNCGAPVVVTGLPDLDVAVPSQLERLIFAAKGVSGVAEFINRWDSGRLYKADDETLSHLSSGFAVSVVGVQRVPSLIHRIFTTNSYVLDTYGALTFGALQDYRATFGDIRQTLLFSEYSPLVHRATVANALNIREYKLTDLI